MDGAAPTVVVVVAAAAAGAFGFVVFLAAKAPDVETAKIARPTRVIFFMLSSPFSLEKWTRQQSSIKLPSRKLSATRQARYVRTAKNPPARTGRLTSLRTARSRSFAYADLIPAVPELTAAANIKINARVSLQPI